MRAAAAARRSGQAAGSPDRAAAPLLQVIDALEPPLREVLGHQALGTARGILERRLETWDRWSAVSASA
jgi:hypothetical protein